MYAKLARQPGPSSGEVPLDELLAQGVQGRPDVGALATWTGDGKVAVMVWHYHDDDVAGPDAAVSLQLRPGQQNAAVRSQWRGQRARQRLHRLAGDGSPPAPNEKQYAMQLRRPGDGRCGAADAGGEPGQRRIEFPPCPVRA